MPAKPEPKRARRQRKARATAPAPERDRYGTETTIGAVDDPSGLPALDGITDDAELSKATLRAVCRDPFAPPAARAQAARTLAEMSGALGRNAKQPADTSRPLAEMSRAEMEAELAALGG